MAILPDPAPPGTPVPHERRGLVDGNEVAGIETAGGEHVPIPVIASAAGAHEPWPVKMLTLFPRGSSPVIDHAERALRDLGVDELESAQRVLPMWRHYGVLSERERLGVIARFAGPRATQTAEAHEIRTQVTPGGNVAVRCTCGRWDGEAPSIRAAERSHGRHQDNAASGGGVS